MEKLKSCISYVLGGIMSLIVFLGLFISTKGYYTNEMINYDDALDKNEARQIFHSIGNGFTGITFKDGAGMIVQSICQILLIILVLALIALAVIQVLKTFNVIKEDALFNNKIAKKLLEFGSLILLLLTLIVFIMYIVCAKPLHYSFGFGSIFNFVVVLLMIFGRKILESKLNMNAKAVH